jgi:hypothetical protein
MYTKIGLGLLAAAGLTFGVIGMQTGGASPAPPLCTNDGSVSSGAGAAGSAAAGGQTGANNPSAADNGTGTGAEGNGTGIDGNNGSGNGTGNGSGNGSGEHAPEATPPTTGNSNPSTGATDDDRFLDVQGNTRQIDVGDGAVTIPSTHPGLTGHSRTLRHLLRIDGHLDTD